MIYDEYSSWQPIQLHELTSLIDNGVARLDIVQKRFWGTVQISPTKWAQHPWGDNGGGFWVVGVLGATVIWYNDIEGGFNTSPYKTAGHIDEYWCDDLDLNHVVHQLLAWIMDAVPMTAKRGPPQSMNS